MLSVDSKTAYLCVDLRALEPVLACSFFDDWEWIWDCFLDE